MSSRNWVCLWRITEGIRLHAFLLPSRSSPGNVLGEVDLTTYGTDGAIGEGAPLRSLYFRYVGRACE